MKSQKTTNNAIIGKAFTFSLALCLTGSAVLLTNTAYAQDPSANVDAQDNASSYSADDLDNLLAPIALYPDPLLAQVLVAATFDDQIQDASQVLSAGSANVAIDDQQWDDSVKAVAHYPKVLFTLAAQPDWTAAIGQAYAAQSTDVTNSVQRLRAMALAQGNLLSTQQQLVAVSDGAIQILPARAGYVFLPSYNPALAFVASAVMSFGPAVAIDASCDDHIDWHSHHIFDGHHHDVRTGYRGSRSSIRNVRGRFNAGDRHPQMARGPVNRGRYNPGFAKTGFNKTGSTYTRPTNSGSSYAGSTHTGSTYAGSTYTGSTKSGSTNVGSTKSGSSNTGSTYTGSTNHGSTKASSANSGSTRGQVNGGKSNAGFNRGQLNRVQSNPAVNRAQVSRGSFTTAMNRGFAGARSAGRTGRR